MPSTATTTVRILTEPIQYRPGQPRDRETSKLIRSHIVENTRRRKRQILLNPQRVCEGSPKGAFCTCAISKSPIDPATAYASESISRALQKQCVIADSYKICQRCRRLQFTELSWFGKLKVAKARMPGISPFLEAEFDPFQTLPELSYSKLSSKNNHQLNEIKAHLVTFWSYEALRSCVLPIAAKDPALFMSLMYSSYAHLNAMNGCGESSLSMAIKAEALRQINIRVQDPEKQNTTLTVASIGYLSSGVCAYGSPSAAQEVQAHEDAMMHIFGQGMKWVVPEDDSLGQTLLHCLALHEFSRAATLGIPLGDMWIAAFCQSSRVISDTDFLPESPLYCPHVDFYSVCKSPLCSLKTLQLLRCVRSVVNSILDDDHKFRYETARTELINMPLVVELSQQTCDYIYESCRLAALLMIAALDARMPFAELDTPLVGQLKSAMQKTDIGDYWGSMSGVLFWVSMVGSAVAVGKPEHSFMNTVLVRGDHDLAYRNTVFECATIAAYNFQRIHMYLQCGAAEKDRPPQENEFSRL